MPSPELEAARLKALRELDILGSAVETHFDAVCHVATSLFKVPIAQVTLLDEDVLWVKASVGMGAEASPRDEAFCQRTLDLADDEALIIPDLHDDPAFVDNPCVRGDPFARFYAAVPIALSSGERIGALCIMDRTPRPDFGTKQTRELFALAQIVEAHLRLYEARNAIGREEQRYRLLAENSTDIIIRTDLQTTRLYVSPASRAVLGYEPKELIGTKSLDFIHPDDAPVFNELFAELAVERIDRMTCCLRYRHKDGRWIWIEGSFILTRDPTSREVTGLVAALRDVSDRKAFEEALRISEERLKLALDGGTDGIWDWDLATGEVRATGRWQSILGYETGGIAPHISAWQNLVHPDDGMRSLQCLIAHFKGFTPRYECEYRVRSKSGAYFWTLTRGKVVAADASGRALRMVGTHTDITRRKTSEQQIAHMATHDGLTGLPNRALFRVELEHAFADAAALGSIFAVLAFDLDDFKVVNDTLGHPAGDLLLKTVAERLKAVSRAGDTVARLGGDEFAIVLADLDHPQDASKAARRAIAALEAPVDVGGHSTRIGVSIGIAVGPRDGRDADQLFKSADIALYQAKGAGRHTFRFYESGMDAKVAARSALERDLRDAVRRQDFVLHYQPVVDLASGTVAGFEALLRWSDPTRGLVTPAEFMAVAEQTGLIVPIGEWALREACREAATWPRPLRIAVNVSAVQFQRAGLEQSVMMTLAASGLAADRLELEITESVLMRDPVSAIACLHRLRGIGVRIALDDFGTGYSSLSYLRQFPFNKIKIDRAFVAEIANPDTAAIVQAVVGLGVRAGAAITAEGVETAEQLSSITNIGCTEVQGFYFSAPLTAAAARTLIGKTSIMHAA